MEKKMGAVKKIIKKIIKPPSPPPPPPEPVAPPPPRVTPTPAPAPAPAPAPVAMPAQIPQAKISAPAEATKATEDMAQSVQRKKKGRRNLIATTSQGLGGEPTTYKATLLG